MKIRIRLDRGCVDPEADWDDEDDEVASRGINFGLCWKDGTLTIGLCCWLLHFWIERPADGS